jgi:orotate phosphoribosyltransferase
VVIALDRMERGLGELSAAQEVTAQFGIPVASVATLDDLVDYLARQGTMAAELAAVDAYRRQYGVSHHG